MSGTPSAPAKRRTPFVQRTFTFTLSIPRMLSVVLLLLLAFVWFFIMGLFLGRGYEPEKDLPELTQYMPKANATAGSVTINAEGGAYSAADNYTEGARSVVEQADRAYRESLRRNQTAGNLPAAGQAPAQASNQPQSQAQAQPPVVAQQTPATGAKDNARFEYVYQVASFKDAAQAKIMADKLVKGGLKARVTESSGSGGAVWHRVVVDHKGTPDSTDTLRSTLKNFKIDKILLVSKKPAA